MTLPLKLPKFPVVHMKDKNKNKNKQLPPSEKKSHLDTHPNIAMSIYAGLY